MIFKILNILFKCRFYLNTPKKSELVVLDDEGIEYLKYILKNRKYFTLVTRSSNLKNIYFSPKVLFFTFVHFKGDLFLAYLSALIHVIKPKIVITYVDNASKFHYLAKLFKDKIKFLAIQNSTRDLEIKINEYVEKKNLYSFGYKQNYYVPYLFCYGQYEIDFCKKKKFKIKDFKKIGSIKVSNFKKIQKLKLLKKKKYDICLIPDAAPNYDDYFKLKGFEQGFAQTIKYTIKFCKENNKKIIFPLKRYFKTFKTEEINFLKKYLNKMELKFLLKNKSDKSKRNKYNSYFKMYESNVTIASATSMLREALSLKKKIMVCNFTPTKIYDFPINKFFFLKNPTYQEFENKLKRILSMSEKKYFNLLGKRSNYIIEDANRVDANDEINSYIDSILKSDKIKKIK